MGRISWTESASFTKGTKLLSYQVKNKILKSTEKSPISAVDLFCGAGGLTHGLLKAGIKVEAGIDIDKQAQYAFEVNNPGAEFLDWDVSSKYSPSVASLFDPTKKYRLLAGCAPCQPFSKLTNGQGKHKSWDLLSYFGRLVKGILPDLVTMENVPELADRGRAVLDEFLKVLKSSGYFCEYKILECEKYGVPQRRRRLVLVASLLGEIQLPKEIYYYPSQWKTVRSTIEELAPIGSGEQDPNDALHVAASLSELNLKRIKATPPDGGTQRDWPEELLLDCHRKKSGQSFYTIYGRMFWGQPAPTMTTLCTGLGNGRFGHPKQDRAISLREAALFQSFPKDYEFWPSNETLNKKAVARFIGNAVPPQLGKVVGKALLDHVKKYE